MKGLTFEGRRCMLAKLPTIVEVELAKQAHASEPVMDYVGIERLFWE